MDSVMEEGEGCSDGSQLETLVEDKTSEPPDDAQSEKTDNFQESPSSSTAASATSTIETSEDIESPHSHSALIAMAISQSPHKMLTLGEICEFILQKFVYYRKRWPKWQSAIRQSLILNECFVTVPPNLCPPGNHRGSFWKLRSESVESFTPGVQSAFREHDVKPPYSYTQLITMAISQSPHKMLVSGEICDFISAKFPYFTRRKAALQKCVLRSLKFDDCFVKVSPQEGPPGKRKYRGYIWTLHPELYKDGVVVRFFHQLPDQSKAVATTPPPHEATHPHEATPPYPVHLDDYGSPPPPRLLSCSSPAEENSPSHPLPHPQNKPLSPPLYPHNEPSSPPPLHPNSGLLLPSPFQSDNGATPRPDPEPAEQMIMEVAEEGEGCSNGRYLEALAEDEAREPVPVPDDAQSEETGNTQESTGSSKIVLPRKIFKKMRSQKMASYSIANLKTSRTVVPCSDGNAATASSSRAVLHSENDAKPPYSYVTLIAMAILQSPRKILSSGEISHVVLRRFPYYKKRLPLLQNAIRRTLCLDECFVKVPRNPLGKFFEWKLHPNASEMTKHEGIVLWRYRFLHHFLQHPNDVLLPPRGAMPPPPEATPYATPPPVQPVTPTSLQPVLFAASPAVQEDAHLQSQPGRSPSLIHQTPKHTVVAVVEEGEDCGNGRQLETSAEDEASEPALAPDDTQSKDSVFPLHKIGISLASSASSLLETIDVKYLRSNDDDVRPPYSYVVLIAMAISQSPHKMLSLGDICKFIRETFPYYRKHWPTWQNTIRRNLSLNDCFVKVPQELGPSSVQTFKGNFWKLHPASSEMFQHGSVVRRKYRFFHQLSSKPDTLLDLLKSSPPDEECTPFPLLNSADQNPKHVVMEEGEGCSDGCQLESSADEETSEAAPAPDEGTHISQESTACSSATSAASTMEASENIEPYIHLIAKAISQSPRGMLTLGEICDFILQNRIVLRKFPYYKVCELTLRSSIQRILTFSELYVSVLPESGSSSEINTGESYWKLHPTASEDSSSLQQKCQFLHQLPLKSGTEATPPLLGAMPPSPMRLEDYGSPPLPRLLSCSSPMEEDPPVPPPLHPHNEPSSPPPLHPAEAQPEHTVMEEGDGRSNGCQQENSAKDEAREPDPTPEDAQSEEMGNSQEPPSSSAAAVPVESLDSALKCSTDNKPQYSYPALIAMAISESPYKMLSSGEIGDHILRAFPYFRRNELSFRKSVRRNLSLDECFVKVPQEYGPSVHRNLWKLHPASAEMFQRGSVRRKYRFLHQLPPKAYRDAKPYLDPRPPTPGATPPHPETTPPPLVQPNSPTSSSLQLLLCPAKPRPKKPTVLGMMKEKESCSNGRQLETSAKDEVSKSAITPDDEESEETGNCGESSIEATARRSPVSTPTCSSDNVKPPYTYIELIAMAIAQSPRGILTSGEISNFILEKFPYYQGRLISLLNTIRRSLSCNACFVKVPVQYGTSGKMFFKGNYWKLHPNSHVSRVCGSHPHRDTEPTPPSLCHPDEPLLSPPPSLLLSASLPDKERTPSPVLIPTADQRPKHTVSVMEEGEGCSDGCQVETSADDEAFEQAPVSDDAQSKETGDSRGSPYFSSVTDVASTMKASEGIELPYSAVVLIAMAISQSAHKKLSLGNICEVILQKFPYYQKHETVLRRSVRHNLGVNDCFVKVSLECYPQGEADDHKECLWKLDSSSAEMFKYDTLSSPRQRHFYYELSEKPYAEATTPPPVLLDELSSSPPPLKLTASSLTEEHMSSPRLCSATSEPYYTISEEGEGCSDGYQLEALAEDEASKPAHDVQREGTGNTQKSPSSSTVADVDGIPASTSNCGNNDKKPPYSNIELIALAISQSPHRMLTSGEICYFVLQQFPYYRRRLLSLQNAIRCNLKLEDCFVKVPLECSPFGKTIISGSFWQHRPQSPEMLARGITTCLKCLFSHRLPRESLSEDTPPHPVRPDGPLSSPPPLLQDSPTVEERTTSLPLLHGPTSPLHPDGRCTSPLLFPVESEPDRMVMDVMEESNGRYLETSAEDEASEPAPAQDNAQNEETGNTQKLSSSSTATASNARVSTFEVSGDDVKPPYTYIALVVMAISQSLHKMLAMDDICEFIFQRFPYYRKRKLGLRHSIQRTLRQDECFVKVPLEPGKRNVRDFVWKLHPASSEMFSSGDFFHRRYRFIYQLPQKFGTEAISNPYDATPPSPVHLDDYGSPSPPHLLSCSSPAEEYLPPHPPPLHPHNEPSSPQLPHPHNKPSSPLPLHPTESQTEHTVMEVTEVGEGCSDGCQLDTEDEASEPAPAQDNAQSEETGNTRESASSSTATAVEHRPVDKKVAAANRRRARNNRIKNMSTSEFSQEDVRPPYSYITLIAMAISQSPDQMLTLGEICEFILKKFSYFEKRWPSWQTSIRHNLSLNDCFVKVPRSGQPVKGCSKGNFWKLHPQSLDMFKHGSDVRRKYRFLHQLPPKDRPSYPRPVAPTLLYTNEFGPYPQAVAPTLVYPHELGPSFSPLHFTALPPPASPLMAFPPRSSLPFLHSVVWPTSEPNTVMEEGEGCSNGHQLETSAKDEAREPVPVPDDAQSEEVGNTQESPSSSTVGTVDGESASTLEPDAEDDNVRPPYTYVDLIAMAILQSPRKVLSSGDICYSIFRRFPYYRKRFSTMQNIVRRYLSIENCFVKVPVKSCPAVFDWTLHPSIFNVIKHNGIVHRRYQFLHQLLQKPDDEAPTTNNEALSRELLDDPVLPTSSAPLPSPTQVEYSPCSPLLHRPGSESTSSSSRVCPRNPRSSPPPLIHCPDMAAFDCDAQNDRVLEFAPPLREEDMTDEESCSNGRQLEETSVEDEASEPAPTPDDTQSEGVDSQSFTTVPECEIGDSQVSSSFITVAATDAGIKALSCRREPPERSDDDAKPPYSIIALITMAISQSPNKMLTSSDMCIFLMAKFPYYQKRWPVWYDSLLHCLHSTNCFVQVGNAYSREAIWTLHPTSCRVADVSYLQRMKCRYDSSSTPYTVVISPPPDESLP